MSYKVATRKNKTYYIVYNGNVNRPYSVYRLDANSMTHKLMKSYQFFFEARLAIWMNRWIWSFNASDIIWSE